MKITNVISVYDNGECWPYGALVFPDISKRGATKIVAIRWMFQGQTYQIYFHERGFVFVDALPDSTGLCAMVGSHPWNIKMAYILNGDNTVRHVLKPAVNMRNFDEKRLAEIQELDEAKATRMFSKPTSHEGQAMFHYKTERADLLEIFGDDGYGDCYYRYDSTTGELLSTEVHPRRS